MPKFVKIKDRYYNSDVIMEFEIRQNPSVVIIKIGDAAEMTITGHDAGLLARSLEAMIIKADD